MSPRESDEQPLVEASSSAKSTRQAARSSLLLSPNSDEQSLQPRDRRAWKQGSLDCKVAWKFGYDAKQGRAWRAPANDLKKKEWTTEIHAHKDAKDTDPMWADWPDGVSWPIHELLVMSFQGARRLEDPNAWRRFRPKGSAKTSCGAGRTNRAMTSNSCINEIVHQAWWR